MPEVHWGTISAGLNDKRLIVTSDDLRIGLLHALCIPEQSMLNILSIWINNYVDDTSWICLRKKKMC